MLLSLSYACLRSSPPGLCNVALCCRRGAASRARASRQVHVSSSQGLAGTCPHPHRPPLSPWWCRDGDVYIGSRWNELSVLYLIFLVTPLLGLLFAWATHGTLWDTGVYY